MKNNKDLEDLSSALDESLNRPKEVEINNLPRYFDKRDNEEECLIEVDDQIQMRYEEIEKHYNQLVPREMYEHAKSKSICERARMGIKDDDNYVYGEMTFRTLSYAYEVCKKYFGEDCFNHGNFYDLGSGHGHVCIQAALLHSFKSCIGIEYLSPLHKMALKAKFKYEKESKEIFKSRKDLFEKHNNFIPELKMVKGDFFEHDWTNASMVFTNSTCFSKSVINEIFEKALYLPKGSFFINTSQAMPKKLMANWHYIPPFQRLMSWGVARLFIYRRRG